LAQYFDGADVYVSQEESLIRAWHCRAGRACPEIENSGRVLVMSRSKLRRGVVAVALGLTMVMVGCSTAWIEQAEEIAAALVPAAANLVTLVATLQGKTVSAADLQLIQNAGTQAGADLQLIQALIAAYQTADTTAQPGILNQIESAITAVQGNLQGLLQALHIQDAATQAKITAVVGILLSEVQSLAAVVPLVRDPASRAQNAREMEHPLPKAPLSASEFVKSYNATMTAKTGNAAVDRVTAGLRIHQHGKLARWGSLGVLQ
jgi:hypothetical protein